MRARLIDRIRLACGLRWKRRTPMAREIGATTQNVLAVLAILLAYGLVGSMDYAEEQRQEAEAAQARAELHQAALLACLNGGTSTGLYTVDANGHKHYIICDGEHFTVSTENVRSASL